MGIEDRYNQNILSLIRTAGRLEINTFDLDLFSTKFLLNKSEGSLLFVYLLLLNVSLASKIRLLNHFPKD